MRAYQRALASGTQLRLVVTAPIVRRVLGVSGLDRLIPVYPSLEAATAAGIPTLPESPKPGRPRAPYSPEMDTAIVRRSRDEA